MCGDLNLNFHGAHQEKILHRWIALVFSGTCIELAQQLLRKKQLTSGETQEDNQNFNCKAGTNSDRANYELKGDGPFVNVNYRNILIVEQERCVGYIYMPFVILYKYEELSV